MKISQLSTEVKGKQLSSAQQGKQSSSAKMSYQLSPDKIQQLRTVKKPKRVSTTASATGEQQSVVNDQDQDQQIDDDTVTLDVDEDEDDLFQEQAQVNNSSDSDQASSDGDDGIFDDMVGAIDIRGEDEFPGAALAEVWAEKVNLAWKTKMRKTALNALLTKYQTPSNLTELKVPRMNKEIWRLLGKWQRKSDLTMSSTQRCLMKAATAALKLNDYIPNNPRSVKQVAMQTTADIISLMARVNQEITVKRKTTIRPCLKVDFKTLSTYTKATENLFGDNLTQDIKDIQVKRKIEEPSSYGAYGYNKNYNQNRRGSFRGGYSRYNSSSSYQNSSGNFLWRGRGRGSGRPYYRTGYQHQSQSHQKKQQ